MLRGGMTDLGGITSRKITGIVHGGLLNMVLHGCRLKLSYLLRAQTVKGVYRKKVVF